MTSLAHIEFIPPAFHILWGAALSDKRLLTSDLSTPLDDLHLSDSSPRSPPRTSHMPFRGHRNRSNSEGSSELSPTYTRSPKRPDPTIRHCINEDAKVTRQLSIELSHEMNSLYAKESAAVIVIECERGEKLVKKSFHDLTTVYGKASRRHGRTEDFLLNWMNSDLTAQQAHTVDVTLYLSCPPQSTTSDGIRLWFEDIRTQGKTATMKIKLASLGCLHPNDLDAVQGQLPEATEDLVLGLKRLQEARVLVSPIGPREWPELLSLLVNKMALRGLEESHTVSTNRLQELLDSH